VITVPAGVRIYLACGATDMRTGFDSLSVMAQEVLKQAGGSLLVGPDEGSVEHQVLVPGIAGEPRPAGSKSMTALAVAYHAGRRRARLPSCANLATPIKRT
jgi:hypothetical protein